MMVVDTVGEKRKEETQKAPMQKRKGAVDAISENTLAKTSLWRSKKVPVHHAIPKIATTPIKPALKTEPEANFSGFTPHTTMMIKAVESITIWINCGIGSWEVPSERFSHEGRSSGIEPKVTETIIPNKKIRTPVLAFGLGRCLSLVSIDARNW